ncbi:MAG: diguanylate cyclase, partial [Gemmatimonadetes bacterium]|nr:diguanylate cyclase [Gemmatimonadota bacterium]
AAVVDAIRVLRVVPDRAWRELPRLVPSFGAIGGAAHEGNRFALFEEVAEFLRLAAISRPIVLLLDDMQWADAASWELLEYLAARLDRERLLVCVTIRDEDVGGEVLGRRARLSRDERFHEVRVARLTREEMALWLSQVLRQETDGELLAYVYRQTEGNPFFTVQVLRALIEEGNLGWNGERWQWTAVEELKLPTAVRDLLSRRLTRLSPQAARTLSAAAVIGRSIDIDLAVAAGIATEDDLLDAIDEGMAASVLEASPLRGDDRVTFTHGLLVEVLHEHVHPRRLRRLHQRVAEALRDRPSAAAADIAVHYAAAGMRNEAYTHALRAAERAEAVYAHDEAMAFLQLAERHATPGEEMAVVWMRLSEINEALGRYEAAEEYATLALAWFATERAPARAARSRRAIARIRGLRGQPLDRTCADCMTLLTAAEEQGLEDERIALLTMLSYAKGQLGDDIGAEALARECLRLAEPRGDARLVAPALVRLGNALVHRSPAMALVEYERAAALFTSADDVYGQMRAEINLGIAHVALGHLGPADVAFERALKRARAVHSLGFAGHAMLNLGASALKCGRYDSARIHLDEAMAIFVQVDHEHARLAAELNLAHLDREENALIRAAERYRGVIARAHPLGIIEMQIGALAGAGLVALALDDLMEARRYATEIERMMEGRQDAWFQGRELAEALVIRLALRVGNAQEAQARFDCGRALADAHELFGAAWLAADYAGALRTADPGPELLETLRGYATRVDELGLTLLTTRYTMLLNAARSHEAANRAASQPPDAAESRLSA